MLARPLDVADRAALETLRDEVMGRFGAVHVLMNNAGIQPGSALFSPAEDWQRILAVNLWGIIHGTQVFVPAMLESGQPGIVVNTGSKQGITTPPGDPAYNVSKAAVKAFTEANADGTGAVPDACGLGACGPGPGAKPGADPGAWPGEEAVT